MKKTILLLVAGVILFSSCAKNENPLQDDNILTGDEVYLSFVVKAPASGAVTYAPVPDAVATESQIFNLYVYVFGPDPNASVANAGTTDGYLLEGTFTYGSPVADGSGAYTVSGIKVTGNNMKHLYFVANRQIPGATTGVTKETAMVNSLAGLIDPAGLQPHISLIGHPRTFLQKGLPMSAYTEADIRTGTPPATMASVEMLRAVARVDIYNATTSYVVENLIIKSHNDGFLFPSLFDATGNYIGLLYTGMNTFTLPTARTDGYAGALAEGGKIGIGNPLDGTGTATGPFPYPGIQPFANNGAVPADTDYASVKRGAGYLYEAPAAAGAEIIVVAKHTVSGLTRAVRAAFVQGTPAVPIDIKRNHVYKFVITESDPNSLVVDPMDVEDWDDGEKVKIDIPLSVAFALSVTAPAPLPAGTTFDGISTLNGVPAGGGAYTVNVNAQGFPISTDDDLMQQYDTDGWITNFDISTQLPDGSYNVTFTVTANPSQAVCPAYIPLFADIDTKPVITLNIIQNAAP
jgi:hypothetical protein